MEYKISKENCIYSMTADNEKVLIASSGSIVVFETFDCFQNQILKEEQEIESIDWDNINPATGPLYIEEAEVGDILKIEILNIEVGSYGVMAAIPGAGLLGHRVEKSQIKIIPIRNNMAIFNENIHIPIDPMIGVIGVAPANGGIPCGAPDSHGGNMDNTKIKKGSTLYLPVFIKGGLLSIGDLHASMGDGEIMVTGVEISGNVKIKVEVIKDKIINNPMLEDMENFYTIASDENLMTAVQTATEDMHRLVVDNLDMSPNEAGMLLSAVGNVEICQVVDPKLTVRFGIPKSIVSLKLK